MSDQAVTPVVLAWNTITAALAGAAATVANDAVLTVPDKDKDVLLLMQITDKGTSGTITIEAGHGHKSGQGDYVIDTSGYTNNDYVALIVESARFKGLSGDDKGKIRVNLGGTNTTATVIAIQLP